MKIIQTKSYVIDTQDEDFKCNQLYLGLYEDDICDVINEFLFNNRIRKEDLIDIKISMISYVTNDIPHLACTVLITYETEVKE